MWFSILLPNPLVSRVNRGTPPHREVLELHIARVDLRQIMVPYLTLTSFIRDSGHVTGCMKTQSGWLPQLDPIALRIGDPAESTDTLHFLGLFRHVRSLGAQLREHRIQVTDAKVEHGLLGARPEVVGLGLERREHRRPGNLAPQAVLIGVQA